MVPNNSDQNHLNSNKSTESEYICIHSDVNFKNSQSKLHNLNTSEYKNDINHNGEVENRLSQKTEQTLERKYFKTRKNNNYNTNNEFVRPAGLSSERCTRDFMSAKNRKYHWNETKMNNGYFDKGDYRENNSERNSDSDRNLNNLIRDKMNDNNSAANYIFKSNRILRNENRLRNTRHSDIFGTNDELNLKRNVSSQSRYYSDNTSNNSLDNNRMSDNDLKLNINSVDNVSTYSLNSKDDYFKYGFDNSNNSNKDSVYSNSLGDYDECEDNFGKRVKKRDLMDNNFHNNYDSDRNFKNRLSNEFNNELKNSVEKVDKIDMVAERGDIGKKDKIKIDKESDNFGNKVDENRSTLTDKEEENKQEYRGIKEGLQFEDKKDDKESSEYKREKEWNKDEYDRELEGKKEMKETMFNLGNERRLLGVVCLKISGLKSETSEKDLETMCRCCKLQIVSIDLDRNIITHTCTGTAKLKLKDPGQENLSNLQDLLKIQGFRCKI